MFKIYDGREHFYQWDLNRKLIVNDDSIKEVHFCNRTEDCSLVCEVYTENGINLVNVPNILLKKCFCINVYAYDGESTKHSTLYKVKPRSKPADYVYTETEVKTWEIYGEKIADLEKGTIKTVENPKIWELETGIYYAIGDIQITSETKVTDTDNKHIFIIYKVETNKDTVRYIHICGEGDGFKGFGFTDCGITDGSSSSWQEYSLIDTRVIVDKIVSYHFPKEIPLARAVYIYGQELLETMQGNLDKKADKTELDTLRNDITAMIGGIENGSY